MELEDKDYEVLESKGFTPEYVCDVLCGRHYGSSKVGLAVGFNNCQMCYLTVDEDYGITPYRRENDLNIIGAYLLGRMEQLLEDKAAEDEWFRRYYAVRSNQDTCPGVVYIEKWATLEGR